VRAPLAGFFILLLLASPDAVPAGAGAREKELRELRGRIEALQKGLAEAEEMKTEAVDALRESERAISETNRALRELGTQSRELDQRLRELGEESRAREAALKSQQALLARLLHQQYLGGHAEPLKLLLNREDPNEISRRLHYFGYISRARGQLITETRASLERLQQLSHETGQKAAELATVTAESRSLRERLGREKRAHGRVLTRISRDIQRQRREIGTLKRNETRLARLIERLSKVVARTPSPRVRNERVPQAPSGTGPFPGLKGKLNLPVRGELANRFGSPRADGGVIWKGLFIAARAGEDVKAIADGRVVFADWLRGFGNLLIVDHGDAYMSLYGNNEALYKRVGDAIRAGDAVAAVGASGGNADSGLYFELRHQGKPLDPLDWVVIR
jgi:septal ring factor EnvC (AmiA/AmiB activator)